MEVLRFLVNSLFITESFNRNYEGDFEKQFAPGSSIQVKFPQSFTVIDGMGYAPQGINRITTTVNLDQWLQIPFEWDDYEDAVKLERSQAEITENYLRPAGLQMAQEWDSRAANWAKTYTSNVMGALGTDPTGVATYYNANQRLLELSCPPGKRNLAISASMMSVFGQNITTFFQPGDELSQMFKEGYLGRAAGFDWAVSNSLYTHTAGTWASSVTVTGGGQSGSTLSITGTTGDTIKAGDKITIASVYQVNPRTRRIPGKAALKQFTVVQDYTLTSGPDTISILPAIYGPGSQYQNVDALPANGAALTLWPGTASPNGKTGTVGLGLSNFAYAFVGAKIYEPKAVEACSQHRDKDTGMAIRFVKAWDPVRSMQIHRFDSLGGFGNLYQDNGAICVVGA